MSVINNQDPERPKNLILGVAALASLATLSLFPSLLERERATPSALSPESPMPSPVVAAVEHIALENMAFPDRVAILSEVSPSPSINSDIVAKVDAPPIALNDAEPHHTNRITVEP